MSDSPVRVERDDPVAIITLDRPAARNALSIDLVAQLTTTLGELDADEATTVIVLTGGEEVFAAGADIAEMADLDHLRAFLDDFAGCCTALAEVRKPVIAAVAGYALGGGCELVEMSDIVLASPSARFAHPEARLGTMPGAGGTQRLPRVVGKHKAMDLLMTGRTIDAQEAERLGLVSRIVEDGSVVAKAVELGRELAELPTATLMMVKEAVNYSFRASLPDGLLHERRLFHMTLAHEDTSEGMRAFLEKRRPRFRNR